MAIRSSPRSRSIPRRSIRTSARSASSRPSLQQRDKLEKEIDQWIKEIRDYNYHEVMFFINQFIGGLYKQLNVHTVKNRESADLFLDFTRRITRFQTLQETADALKDLALRLCSLSEESGAVRHAEVVDFIQMYVRKHYARPDMSLEQVAGEVKLSRSYVGKLFKAHCELSFNDYLNAVRLEKARELSQAPRSPFNRSASRWAS